MAIKREILGTWKNDSTENRQFRLVVEIDEQRGIFDIYIEQLVYMNNVGKDMWLRVEAQHYVADCSVMSMFLTLSLFENLVSYIKKNFYSIGGCCD